MSGQCLSPSEGGHALTPPTRRCLGVPLPHQQADRPKASPEAKNRLHGNDLRPPMTIEY